MKKKATNAILTYTYTKDKTGALSVNGTALEITAALFSCISAVYADLCSDINPVMAEILKKIIQEAVADNDSPVWDINKSMGSRVFIRLPSEKEGEE